MTQIDYNRREYDRVAAKGQELLRSLSDPELAPELNRITGLSFFKLGDYQQAKVFLKKYTSLIDGSPAPDAIYALAVADYADGDYSAAAEKFATLTELDNDLAQSAWLYLGQCDVKTVATMMLPQWRSRRRRAWIMTAMCRKWLSTTTWQL